jgi:DNA-binding CsgD family transcriptional regulator
MHWFGIDDAHINEYHQRIQNVSPYIKPALELADPRFCSAGERAVPRRELVGTEFHDWMLRGGSNDSLSAVDYRPDTGLVALGAFVETGRRVTDDQVDFVADLLPHLFHAIALSRQLSLLQIQNHLGREALSRADFGCAIVDARGRLDWMNDAARRILERDDVLEVVDERFRARHPASRHALETAIRSAIGVRDTDDKPTDPEYIFTLQRIDEGRPVEMLVSPLRPLGHPLFGELHGALLIFSDPEHLDEGIAERLQQAYDLTPTEAEVAQWLMAGTSTNDIADIFGNSIHTIRTHVKRVMRKCGASSQVELVGLLQRSLVRLA